MQLICQGEISAFDEIYSRYSKRLLYFFCRMLGHDEERAQDFLQDLFLKIIEKSNLYQEEKKFSTWIYTIANNMCKSEYRYRLVRKNIRNEGNVDLILPDESPDEHPSEKNIDRMNFRKALFCELESLKSEQRAVFLLKYQENFSIKKISSIMKCSEGTVKSRLFYATKKLAEKLKDYNTTIN
ncbi:RNA polymerase sigma factor [candidate division KSB1 bacterium]